MIKGGAATVCTTSHARVTPSLLFGGVKTGLGPLWQRDGIQRECARLHALSLQYEYSRI